MNGRESDFVAGVFARISSVGSLLFGVTSSLIAGPVWQKPSLSLGSLDLNGGLHQSFHLGTLNGSPEFAFPIFLQHGFRPEEPVSDYTIPQLTSYVVPEGRDGIVWLEPGGIRHQFKNTDLLTEVPDEIAAPWVAVKTGPVDYDFYSDDKWVYRYKGGAIVSLSAPTGRTLLFETEGLHISRVFQKARGEEVTLLKLSEDEIGLPNELTLGPVIHRFIHDEDMEQLKEWQASTIEYQAVSFSYDEQHLVSTVTFPGGDTLSYKWGGSGGEWQQDSELKLPKGGAGFFLIGDDDFNYRYGISRQGISLSRTDAADISDGFVYNPKTQQMIVNNRDGGQVTRFFGLRGDERGRLQSVRDARGRKAVALTYDPEGRVKTRKVPGAAPLRYEYDSLGRLIAVYRLENLHQKFEYEEESQKPSVITNALGHSIYTAYNEAGQVRRYQSLDGAVYEYEYDELGQLKLEKLPMGYQRSIERDEFNRVVKEVHLDGSKTSYEYTAENRLAATQQDGKTWEYQYDQSGVLAQLNRDGQMWQKIEREKLDGIDREVVKNTRFDGKTNSYELDAQGNVKKRVDAMGQTTEFKHDELGQLTGWKDGRGVVAEFERDALGRVAEVETEGAKPLQMAYDQTGRLTRRTTGEQDIQYRYNKEGQLHQIDYGKGQAVDYTYDKYGRLLTALTGQGVKTSYTWDALDRRTSERTDIPNGNWTLVKWTYTAGGKKETVSIYKNGDGPEHCLQETKYAYDHYGRYTGIFVNGKQKIWYDYQTRDLRIKRKRFYNGWTIDYEHHEDGHPKSIVAKNGEGKVIKDVSYIWNEEGKLQSRTLDGVLHDYSYDQLGRLTEVKKTRHISAVKAGPSGKSNTKPSGKTSDSIQN